MHIGMLWFDNTDNVSLKERIEKAVDYYRRKYHQEPNLCLLAPAFIQKNTKLPVIDGIEIRTYEPVLPGHLWIGIQDKD